MKFSATVLLLLGISAGAFAAATAVFDGTFTGHAGAPPDGWKIYGQSANPKAVQVVETESGKAVRIDDDNEKTETGIYRDFPAQEGLYYRATLKSAGVEGRKYAGAQLQMRFLPVDKFKQTGIGGDLAVVDMQAPPGTRQVRIYVYTHFNPTPALIAKSVKLESDVEAFAPVAVTPAAKSVPDFGKRDLCIDTALVKDGRPAARIAIPAKFRPLADEVNAAVKRKTGIELPVVTDEEYRDLKKLDGNLIVFGNRDDNAAIAKLYMLYYTMLDAVHPGKAGHEVRSLHNPFGDGFNIVFAGGSEDEGTAAAVKNLAARIDALPAGKELALPYLLDVVLDPARLKSIPASTDDTAFWGISRSYGKRGYYGWNSISKNMALFYLTGDEKYAKEMLRLAFPTPEVAAELLKRDDEAYWDPKRPLATPYHYRSIFMILYWDLIEEHPFFTGEMRKKITEQLYMQFDSNESGEFNILSSATRPMPVVGDRHVAWEAVSLYTIGRYFGKYHPDRNSERSLAAAANVYASLNQYMALEYGSLFWYNTYLEPLIVYAVLSDGRKYENSPSIRSYGEALLALTDGTADWSNASTSLNMLGKLAYLTQDQAYIDQLKSLKVNPAEFRLGQSWWPRREFPNNAFKKYAGKFFKPNLKTDIMKSFQVRSPNIPLENAVHFLSYRQKADPSGDFLLIDTKYESGRNPFHNFALLNVTLAGKPMLRGHSNQLAFYRNGTATGSQSFITDVRQYGKVGDSVFVDGKILDYNGHDWERLLLLRESKYLITVDTVTPLSDMQSSLIESCWEPAEGGSLTVKNDAECNITYKDAAFVLSCATPAEVEIVDVTRSAGSAGKAARYSINQPGKAGAVTRLVTLVRPGTAGQEPVTARDGDTVALRLPQPALLNIVGDGFILTEADHLAGCNVREVPGLFKEDRPVAFDFNAKTKELVIQYANQEPVLRKIVNGFALPAAAELEKEASRIIAGREKYQPVKIEAPALAESWKIKAEGFVGAMCSFRRDHQAYTFFGAGKTAYLCDFSGKILRQFPMAATVGAVAYWPEAGLLLVGCQDEKLTAYTFDGVKKWEYTSQMAQELIDSVKFYWFKSAIPGVIYLASTTLEPGRSLLYVGSAGTVEALDADGKLVGRFWQTWGAVSGSAFIPAVADRPAELRFYRYMGGNPDVYALRSDGKGGLVQKSLGLSQDKAGVWMGSYGFSMVGRYGMAAADFGDGLRTAEGLNGAHNRLIVRRPDGKIEAEVDLGPGFLAAGSTTQNYGRDALTRRNIRGFEVADLDGNGKPEIAVAVNRKFVAAFDGKLQMKWLAALPDNPVRMIVVPGTQPRIAAGCFDGQIFILDGRGTIVKSARIPGVPVALAAADGRLVVGSDKGEIFGFDL